MQTNIRVRLKKQVDNSYNIILGVNLLDAAKHLALLKPGDTYFIITDTNIRKLYGKQLVRSFKEQGLRCSVVSIPPGESFKNRSVKEALEDTLLARRAGRDSVIIGFGGGVVGDISGYIAATLHRGVPFVQIPTTLLAQVDSSIGGKVAVDHPRGKNLIGAFYQPKVVYIDPGTLNSLPDFEFSCGMAEVIKYAAIMDSRFFRYLETHGTTILQREQPALHKIIKRCCELKRYVVEKDEKEADLRRILNFGHTVGHAVELLMNYSVSHGHAVAIGMAVETKISVALGLIKPEAYQRLLRLIHHYNLPTQLPKSINLSKLFRATLQDKKAKAGVVHYTLLEEIGKASIGVPLDHHEALTLFKQ